jgi:hypothetical protein
VQSGNAFPALNPVPSSGIAAQNEPAFSKFSNSSFASEKLGVT